MTVDLTSALVGLAWSLLGFTVGFTAGRLTREVHEIREHVVPDPTTGPERRHRPRLPPDRILGFVMVVLAVSSVSVTWYAATEQRRVAACQADYNEAFAAAVAERNQTLADDRTALINLTDTLIDPAVNDRAQRAALIRYNAALRESDRKRAQNPLPTPARCA